MKRHINYSLLVVFSAIVLCSCRTTKYDFTKIHLNTNLASSARVAIAVQDLRPFLMSGEKPASYIGIHRDGLGIPKDGANTKSGKPLAEDLSALLVANLSRNGFKARSFLLSSSDDEQSAIEKGITQPTDRILILRMEQFRSDSWAEVELNWKFRLDIYDENGKKVATAENEGFEEGLKRNYTGAISDGQAQKVLSEKLVSIFNTLLSSPDCITALQTGNWPNETATLPLAETAIHPQRQSISSPLQPPPREIAKFNSDLHNGNYQSVLEWAKSRAEDQEIPSREILDAMAYTIWDRRMESDEVLIDALSYLCVAVGKSKDARYRLLIEVVKNESKTRKLRRYAQKSLRGMPIDATVEQYVPGKKQVSFKENPYSEQTI